MKTVWGLAAALFLVSGGLHGCGRRPPSSPITVEVDVSPAPPRMGTATVTVTLRDGDGAPFSGANVRLEGNMSHAGMQPTFADAREIETGKYRAPLELTMAGDWFITVTARHPDGRTFESQSPLKGVRAQ